MQIVLRAAKSLKTAAKTGALSIQPRDMVLKFPGRVFWSLSIFPKNEPINQNIPEIMGGTSDGNGNSQ